MQNDSQIGSSDVVTDCISNVQLKINSDKKDDDFDCSKFEKQLNINENNHDNSNQISEMKKQLIKSIQMINDKNFIIAHRQQQQQKQVVQVSQVKEFQDQKNKDNLKQITLIQTIKDQQIPYQQSIPATPPKIYHSQPQIIKKFSVLHKSSSISITSQLRQCQQSKAYYQNLKLTLTQPITSISSQISFRLDNIKYCVGVGIGLQEILQKHDYDYKSTTSNETGHGLYIVTSQGYSWSHSEEQQDDKFREGFNILYSGVNLNVKLEGENLIFKWKKGEFMMLVPSRIREKYTLCFCVYLHDKTDAVSINC